MDLKNIQKKYRPILFWSWNERLNVNETISQIKEMDKVGFGGFFMHARGGLQTEYMGDEWFENVDACIKACAENGMYSWAYDENGWPSGFGNGIVNRMGIEYQQKYLRFERGDGHSKTTITNSGGYHFYYDVNPFYVDTLSGKVVKAFIENIYKPYYDRYKGRIAGMFTDEPQISRNGIPWSFTLPEEYKRKYGEDLLPRLPELFFETGEYKKTRIRFWKLVCELFSQNYMKQIYDWCNTHGLQFTGHLVCEEFLQSQVITNGACMPHYEYMTIPGMDWLGRHNTPSLTPYQVGSAARQLGKSQVLSETFAMCGHNVGHDELKWIYEYQMVRGVTLMCQHLGGYSNRGLRKRDYPPAMYIQQPWWEYSKLFNDAMSRIGMLLSGGDDGVEVLVIHPQTTVWTMFNRESARRINEATKRNSTKAIEDFNDSFLSLIASLERKHINFHLGDEILIERHGKVDGKYFIIGEKKYSTVILPEHDVFLENTECLLKQFKRNGGCITTAEQVKENDIIDIADITYCQRSFDDFDMYYFVNSTANTYNAFIKKGNKVMDPATGDLSNFDGHYTFKKYESLVVIDDGKKRSDMIMANQLLPIDLGGEWDITECTDNILVLDYCDYYFDDELIERNGYILNATYRALDLMRPVKIRCEYTFAADYVPKKLYLVCETPEKFDICVNGVHIDRTDCGFFLDKAFRRLDIAKNIKQGSNIITIETDFVQSEEVYANIQKSKVFESEKNKLTFDMEIEQMYLVGDFSVSTNGEFFELERNACRFSGEFVLATPKKKCSLLNIQKQGFPFFAGSITVRKKFNVYTRNMMLDFEKSGINVVKAKINGKELSPFMWEPYTADVSKLITLGENEIELTLINNLRNMQGPFHLAEGESHNVVPASFYKEDCLWIKGFSKDRWNDDYCLADITVKNRKSQIIEKR